MPRGGHPPHQAHKYERGINRVSAGRLYELARVLSVEVGFFFQTIADSKPESFSTRQRMCLDLARNFSRINDERQQEALAQLTRILADKDKTDRQH